jgi:uncharacterized protein YbjT (DUF2867 family)
MKKKAIIAGATGLVGSELLGFLLKSRDYDSVFALVRKPTKTHHPKLKEIVFDFNNSASYKNLPKSDEMFCCLGTTIKTAGSEAAFKKVDFEYPMLLAEAGKSNGIKAFHVITALGADANSPMFYNKVKGQLEEALKKLNFEQLYIYQPSLLVGNRSENRLGEKIAIQVMPIFEFLMLGPMKKYRSIKVEDVAKGIINTAENEHKKLKIILSDEIQNLANNRSNS